MADAIVFTAIGSRQRLYPGEAMHNVSNSKTLSQFYAISFITYYAHIPMGIDLLHTQLHITCLLGRIVNLV